MSAHLHPVTRASFGPDDESPAPAPSSARRRWRYLGEVLTGAMLGVLAAALVVVLGGAS